MKANRTILIAPFQPTTYRRGSRGMQKVETPRLRLVISLRRSLNRPSDLSVHTIFPRRI